MTYQVEFNLVNTINKMATH